ncbi:hypothetical protein HK097_008186 [Rhizophlyctis rosea]|uniref:Ankyrin n=1 Tax=Rhizophlyctis rosea TaxID=64517 RepID=A0AAD5X1U8_9FUNG|nr:hypothetical protein HK097_008186 [Rhizophlyctis rosea]
MSYSTTTSYLDYDTLRIIAFYCTTQTAVRLRSSNRLLHKTISPTDFASVALYEDLYPYSPDFSAPNDATFHCGLGKLITKGAPEYLAIPYVALLVKWRYLHPQSYRERRIGFYPYSGHLREKLAAHAIKNNQSSLLRTICETLPPKDYISIAHRIIYNAAVNHHNEVLEIISPLARPDHDLILVMIRGAAESNNIEAVKCCMRNPSYLMYLHFLQLSEVYCKSPEIAAMIAKVTIHDHWWLRAFKAVVPPFGKTGQRGSPAEFREAWEAQLPYLDFLFNTLHPIPPSTMGKCLDIALRTAPVSVVRLFLRKGGGDAMGARIHLAVLYNTADVVKLVVDCVTDCDEASQLHYYAASRGDMEILGYVLELYENRAWGGSEVPVRIAAGKGHVDIVRRLLEVGFRLDGKALLAAVRGGHLEMVRYLLDCATDIIDVETVTRALRISIEKGYEDIAAFLLSKKPMPELDAKSTFTLAARLSSVQPLSRFLAAGADIHIHDDEPLYAAAGVGRADVVE